MPAFAERQWFEVSAAIRTHKPGYTKLYVGYLYPTGGHQRYNVEVPVDIGYNVANTVDELDTDYWVPRDPSARHVVNLSRYRHTITSLHPDNPSATPLNHRYVLYYVDQTRTDQVKNSSLRSVVPSFNKLWYGNILVVKTNGHGAVQNMGPRDSYLVNALVTMAIDEELMS